MCIHCYLCISLWWSCSSKKLFLLCRGLKLFGKDILSNNARYELDSKDELPPSKCNTVSLLKPDFAPAEYRNMLAVTDTFICYTVRRTLVRVIHTVSSEKTLLRGHEYTIVDMKYGLNNSKMLCTIDDGGDPSAPTNTAASHVFVWKLDDSKKEIPATKICALGLMANVVQPHPTHANLWGLGRSDCAKNVGYIGIFSSVDCNQDNSPSYESLPMHAVLQGKCVTDVSFSADGKCIFACVSDNCSTKDTHIGVWSLSFVAGVGEHSYRESSLAMSFLLPMPYCVAVRGLSVGIVCASQPPQPSSHKNAELRISVWPLIPTQHHSFVTSLEATQHLTVCLPAYEPHHPYLPRMDDITVGFQHVNYSLNTVASNPGIVILAHRGSAFVGCLALNPLVPGFNHTLTPGRQPINHVTLVNTNAPVESIGCSVIAGREHHSEDDISHLEIACYQPHPDGMTAQTAVQQFHVPLCNLFNHEATAAHALTVSSVPSATKATVGVPSLANSINITALLNNGAATSKPSTGPNAAPYVTSIASPTDPIFSGLPVLAPTDASQGTSLLGMINKNRKSNSVKASTDTAAVSTAVLTTPPTPGPGPVFVPQFAPQEPPHVPPTSSDALPPGQVSASSGASVGGRSIIGMFKSALNPPQSTVPAPAHLSTQATDVNVPTSLNARVVSGFPEPYPVGAANGDKIEVGDNDDEGEDEEIGDPSELLALNGAVLAEIESVVDSAVERATQASTNSIIEEIRRTLADVSSGPGTKAINNSSEAVSLTQAVTQAVTSTVKKTLEQESKRHADSLSKTLCLSEELAKSIASQVSTSPALTHTLQGHVQSVVTSTVRETLKQEMVAGFKQTFESTILPAFQAGANKMFAQIQATFDTGLKQMMDEASRTNRSQSATMQQLKDEVTNVEFYFVCPVTLMFLCRLCTYVTPCRISSLRLLN
jgi:hypothetical protein